MDVSVKGAAPYTAFQFERNGFFSVDPDTTSGKVRFPTQLSTQFSSQFLSQFSTQFPTQLHCRIIFKFEDGSEEHIFLGTDQAIYWNITAAVIDPKLCSPPCLSTFIRDSGCFFRWSSIEQSR